MAFIDHVWFKHVYFVYGLIFLIIDFRQSCDVHNSDIVTQWYIIHNDDTVLFPRHAMIHSTRVRRKSYRVQCTPPYIVRTCITYNIVRVSDIYDVHCTTYIVRVPLSRGILTLRIEVHYTTKNTITYLLWLI